MDKQRQFPIGSGVRMADLSVTPYDTFRRLQQFEPVSWIEEIQMWFITRREDVLSILAYTETFTVDHPSVLKSILGINMLTTDGAAQYRLRKPFAGAFAPRTIRTEASVMIEQLTHRLIDAFIAEGQADLKYAFADKLALLTVTQVLGLPIHDYDQFRQWYTDFAIGLGNFTGDTTIAAQASASKHAFKTYVLNHLHDSSHHILQSVADENDLSDDELVDAACVMIFGGLETTAALIANTLWALLKHPDQSAQALMNPLLLPNAIEETLRWESPVQTATRHITRDIVVRGVVLKAGDALQCMLGAANRDDHYFDAPDQFDIHRMNAGDHLGFGYGKHFCIGAGLARLEGQIGLRILFERLPHLRFHPDYPCKVQGHEFRAPSHLILQWDV